MAAVLNRRQDFEGKKEVSQRQLQKADTVADVDILPKKQPYGKGMRCLASETPKA